MAWLRGKLCGARLTGGILSAGRLTRETALGIPGRTQLGSGKVFAQGGGGAAVRKDSRSRIDMSTVPASDVPSGSVEAGAAIRKEDDEERRGSDERAARSTRK